MQLESQTGVGCLEGHDPRTPVHRRALCNPGGQDGGARLGGVLGGSFRALRSLPPAAALPLVRCIANVAAAPRGIGWLHDAAGITLEATVRLARSVAAHGQHAAQRAACSTAGAGRAAVSANPGAPASPRAPAEVDAPCRSVGGQQAAGAGGVDSGAGQAGASARPLPDLCREGGGSDSWAVGERAEGPRPGERPGETVALQLHGLLCQVVFLGLPGMCCVRAGVRVYAAS